MAAKKIHRLRKNKSSSGEKSQKRTQTSNLRIDGNRYPDYSWLDEVYPTSIVAFIDTASAFSIMNISDCDEHVTGTRNLSKHSDDIASATTYVHHAEP